jgi:hypothetical protein
MPSTFTCLECGHIYIGLICNICKVPKGEMSCGCRFDGDEWRYCLEHHEEPSDDRYNDPRHVPYSNLGRGKNR